MRMRIVLRGSSGFGGNKREKQHHNWMAIFMVCIDNLRKTEYSLKWENKYSFFAKTVHERIPLEIRVFDGLIVHLLYSS